MAKLKMKWKLGLYDPYNLPVVATSLYGIRQELMVSVRSNLACFSR